MALLLQLAVGFQPQFDFQNVSPLDQATEYASPGCCKCSFKDTMYMNTACTGNYPFMTLIQNTISSRCDIADSCRRLGTEEVSETEWYDFVIVGAGVAGPIIARRLSDNPWWKVLLIEAGPEEPSMTAVPGFATYAINSSLDWNFKTEPTQPHPTACLGNDGVCTWPRGKMVSGTGGMYGMMYVRGHPEIYNTWARQGATGWSYEEVVHYFERAEDPIDPLILSDKFRTVAERGPMKIQFYQDKPPFADDVLRAAGQLGYRTDPLKEHTQTGFTIAPMVVDQGMRGTTSRAYLRPVHGRHNLKVLINHQVTRILMSPWENKAQAVEMIGRNGVRKVVKVNKEVILTAGAIGSPHILLNSGIGPKDDLTSLGINVFKDLPVGKNLHNHVSVDVHLSIKDKPYDRLTMDAVNEYLENRTGPLSSTGLTQVTGFLESSYAVTGVPDLQVFFDGFLTKCSKTGLDFECEHGLLQNCPGRREIVARPTTVIPESRGYMKLRSNDPTLPPSIYPNYFSDVKDLKVLVEGIKKVIELTKTDAMKKWDLRLENYVHPLCRNYHFASDAYWECVIRVATGPENHQSGSCKMGGYNEETAVVDPELRVRGIPNIRVADASIFPLVPNSNPIAAIMMVAEKASDMVTNSWPKM